MSVCPASNVTDSASDIGTCPYTYTVSAVFLRSRIAPVPAVTPRVRSTVSNVALPSVLMVTLSAPFHAPSVPTSYTSYLSADLSYTYIFVPGARFFE